MIGVVVPQHIEYGDPALRQRRAGFAINIAAGGIGGAVRSVAAHGEDRRTGNVCNAGSRSKRQFLISPSEAVPGQVYDSFTACDKRERSVGLKVAFENTCKEAARLPRLAAELIGQDDGIISELLRSGSSGGTQLTHRAVDVSSRTEPLMCVSTL